LRPRERQLRSVQAEVRAGKAELEASQSRLRAQQAVVADSNPPARQPAHPIAEHPVLRVSVLDKLKRAIEAQLGSNQPKQRTTRHHRQQR